jgi:hypothetical protein
MPERVKHQDILILVAAWTALYLPYILFGGLLRDDLGLLLIDRSPFANYFDYQWVVSSSMNMTARPVAAILQGLCNWYFETAAWKYHLVNLALFGGSVLFFYLTLRELISCDVALLASLFALVYPCASGTVFSSTMMNSNLAALFWSSATYILAGDFRGKYIPAALLLGLSSLSYESFIPLFIFNAAIILLVAKPDGQGRRRLFFDVLPVFAAIFIYVLYRWVGEKTIFHAQFSRILLVSPLEALVRFFMSLVLGFRIALVDSFEISLRALNNLDLVSIQYLLVVASGLALLWVYLSGGKTLETADSGDSGYIRKFASPHASFQIERVHYLDFCIAALVLFCCAHLIYAISWYKPDPAGFENRTLGGMRFVTALSIAVSIKAVDSFLVRRTLKKIMLALTIGLLSLFSFSIIGQREAWSAAAQYNEFLAGRINGALREKHLEDEKTLTLVAVLPTTFPDQVNQEPILGASWDITSLMSLTNPGMTVKAGVYNADASATVYPDKVAFVILKHKWDAPYPFWLYKFDGDELYRIDSGQDWYSHTNQEGE